MITSRIARITRSSAGTLARLLVIKVSETQLPDLWTAHQHMCRVLDMPAEYDLYVTAPVPGAALAIGSQNPMIVIDSTLLQLMGPGEKRAIIAHELGHILSDHMVYVTALDILLSVSNGLPFFIGLPFGAVPTSVLVSTT